MADWSGVRGAREEAGQEIGATEENFFVEINVRFWLK